MVFILSITIASTFVCLRKRFVIVRSFSGYKFIHALSIGTHYIIIYKNTVLLLMQIYVICIWFKSSLSNVIGHQSFLFLHWLDLISGAYFMPTFYQVNTLSSSIILIVCFSVIIVLSCNNFFSLTLDIYYYCGHALI